MTPLISIIVPVYKVEDVIHNCVESILRQTYSNFELILIDDGTPDESGKICDEYAKKDNRIKVIHKTNGGVSSARNIGIANATGEYIVCVDSDDYVDEAYLQGFIDVIKIYPEAQMVWCGFYTVNDYEKTITRAVKYDESGELIESDISNIMTFHQKWLDAAPWCKLYSKRIIDENNLKMDESMSLGEDLLFNFSYINSCTNKKIYHTNKCAYYYIQTEKETLDNRFRANLFDIYTHINDEMLRYITNWKVDSEQMTIFYDSAYFSYEKCLRNTFHKNNTATKKEKYQLNKKIMQSSRFKEAVKNSSCKIRLPLKIAYKLNSYKLVEAANALTSSLYKLKNSIR